MSTLSESQMQELLNIARNQPVFSGDLQSHQDAEKLIELKLVMRYEGRYVLTKSGQKWYDRFNEVFAK